MTSFVTTNENWIVLFVQLYKFAIYFQCNFSLINEQVLNHYLWFTN